MKATKKLIRPSIAEDAAINAGIAGDADTLEITQGLIQRMRKAGRPEVETPKESVTMRLDAELLAALRASGKGWQTRANQVLGEALKKGKFSPQQ